MKLLFCLFRYFPFGGLQRDFKHIAEVCRQRGHLIYVLTTEWEGDKPPGFNISIIPRRGFSNHVRSMNFAKQVSGYIEKEHFDAVTGFNKMPGLDLYYAADSCYKARAMEEKGFLYRLGSRYRMYEALEKAVFKPSSKTHIMLISAREKEKFIKYYHTPEGRFHILPPGITRDRCLNDSTGEIRRKVRDESGIKADEFFLLMVGSSFGTKGLDRAILAMAGLPAGIREKTKLFVIGRGAAEPFKKMATRRKIAGQLFFLGGRDDVPRFLAGADLLLHPAYLENTGTVLVEAMAAGLPVLATDICGYGYHVEKAGAGLLIPSPFQQHTFNKMLQDMLASQDREKWGENGIKYISENDMFSMPEKAADIIEAMVQEKK